MARVKQTSTGAPPAPRPKAPPVIGIGPKFIKDLLGTFVAGWRECGDVVYYAVPRPMLAATRPEYVEEVLVERIGTHPKSAVVREVMEPMLGQSQFSADGAAYDRLEAITAPALRQGAGERLARVVESNTAEMLDRWLPRAARGDTFDVQAEMVQLALDVGGETMFGALWAPMAAQAREDYVGVAEYLIPRVTGLTTPIDRFLPARRRSDAAVARLDDLWYEAIRQRRREPADDWASLLLEARSETGETLTDKQVRDEVGARMFGFYKSLGPVLTWTWHLLSLHPDVAERVRAEALGDGDRPYTAMTVDEVLRLYPPIYLFSRPAQEDEVIGGYHVPKTTFVVINPYITHRHPDYWDNPEGFDPERFTPERVAARHPWAYFPFAGGKRRCDGEHVALAALRQIVSAVCARYRLDVSPGHKVERKPHFVLRPSNGLPVTLRPAA